MTTERKRPPSSNLSVITLLKNNNLKLEILKYFYDKTEIVNSSKLPKDLAALKISTKLIHGNVDLNKRYEYGGLCGLWSKFSKCNVAICEIADTGDAPLGNWSSLIICWYPLYIPLFAVGGAVSGCGFLAGSVKDGIHHCQEDKNEGIDLRISNNRM